MPCVYSVVNRLAYFPSVMSLMYFYFIFFVTLRCFFIIVLLRFFFVLRLFIIFSILCFLFLVSFLLVPFLCISLSYSCTLYLLTQSVPLNAELAMTACRRSSGKCVSHKVEEPSRARGWVSGYVGHSVLSLSKFCS